MNQPRHLSATERLATPVQFVKGVGAPRAEMLQRLGLRTAADLLFLFPRDYRDASQLLPIGELREEQPASVCGVVEEVELRNTGPGRCVLGVLIRQDQEHLRVLWFNQPWMRDRVVIGQRVLLSGTPRFNGGRWELVHPKLEALEGNHSPTKGRIFPVYPLTEGLQQWQIRRIVQTAVQEYAVCVPEVFPADFREQHRLWPIQRALEQIHAPGDMESLDAARRRFIYQELLVLQLALGLRRRQLAERTRAPTLPVTAKIDARIRRLFPFDLTADQDRVLREIAADMARTTPMNRLLQGDVGSGKTVVAEYAMLLAIAHGHPAALMAPTEMLARQHLRTLSRDLRESRVRIVLLTGALSAAERRVAREAIAAEEADLIVGTHALLAEEPLRERLGLVVIDEQHKFGVRQRAALRGEQRDPHYLVMTATPIPRTVSMTLFGDLDVSTLRDKPPGRAPLYTYSGDESRRAAWWDFFCRKLAEGRQGYVVAPMVEGGEGEAVTAVEPLYKTLQQGPLRDFRIALLHGRIPVAEREATMKAFRLGEIQVLVATSVVEVGIDVPNATLMTIEDGQRFGLAQLHQLRGRISRGSHPGYLCVFGTFDSEESRERIEAFCQSSDGFELAEVDFRLRGPGDLFGTRQHGLPPLRIADLNRDEAVLEEARQDAGQLVLTGELGERPEFARLYNMVLRRYGAVLELADVG